MNRLKILLTRSLVPDDIKYIKDGLNKRIEGCYEFISPSEFSEEEIIKQVEDIDVLLGPFVTQKILVAAKQLKLIQVPWTGMDTFDFEAAKNCLVPICNTHSNADSVAEIGVAILLDLLKKISYHDRKMRNGNWNRDQHPLNLKSKMLSNQTVCIIGCGNIGYRIAKLIFAFGASIIAVDENRKTDDVISEVYSIDKICTAVSRADILVSALPLTTATTNIIDDALINNMKDGVIIINMSRAAVMDEDAIYMGLRSERISGFGADVWWNAPKRGESESYPSTRNEFWKLDNVVMSPHRAGFVEDCLPHLDGTIENIVRLYRNEKLQGIVDINKQY